MSNKQSPNTLGSTPSSAGVNATVGQRRPLSSRVFPYVISAAVIVVLVVIARSVLTPAATAAPATLSTAGGCVATANSPAIPSQCAPNFTLADYKGKMVTLSRYRGHPVLVNFWGVDCTNCAAELPDLKAFAATFAQHGGVVLSVNTWHEAPSYIASYAAAQQVSWPLLPDEQGVTGNRYGVTRTPTNVYVDAHGVIRSVAVGQQSRTQFEQNAKLL